MELVSTLHWAVEAVSKWVATVLLREMGRVCIKLDTITRVSNLLGLS